MNPRHRNFKLRTSLGNGFVRNMKSTTFPLTMWVSIRALKCRLSGIVPVPLAAFLAMIGDVFYVLSVPTVLLAG